MSVKKEERSSYLVYNIISLGKMAGNAEPFSWRLVEDEIAVKYLKNLAIAKSVAILNDCKYSICSTLDFE